MATDRTATTTPTTLTTTTPTQTSAQKILELKPKPKPSSKGQYIYKRTVLPPKTIDPHDVKNVYRSQQQIQRAIQNGTFDHAKIMHMDFNTKNIYWLCTEQ